MNTGGKECCILEAMTTLYTLPVQGEIIEDFSVLYKSYNWAWGAITDPTIWQW